MLPRSRSSVHATVDRFGWPVIFVLLLFALVTVGAAVAQSLQVQREFRERDRATADLYRSFEETAVQQLLSEQGQFVATHADVFSKGDTQALQQTMRTDYIARQDAAVAAFVTAPDGAILVSAYAPEGASLSSVTLAEVSAVARSAAGSGTPVTSGQLGTGDRSLYAHASPLTGVAPAFGAWVVVRDVDATPLAGLFEASDRKQAEVRLVDDRGRSLLSSRARARDTVQERTPEVVRRAVRGSTWDIEVWASPPPGAVPPFVFTLLLVAMLLLAALYWLQESTRRRLRADAGTAAMRVQRLVDFANQMLHSSSPREQSLHLARAIINVTAAEAACVNVARERDRGVLCGDMPDPARTYRLAIVGPKGAVGEALSFSRVPLTPNDRALMATLGAMAGVAMHTLLSLEKERTAAEDLQRLDELRTNLLSTVAHELRSPLTAIKGVLSLLSMQGGLSPKQEEYVDVASERTDALVELIQDLFDCSLMESGQLDIKPERRVAADLLQTSLGALAASRPDDLILSPSPNLMITVDPLRFDQIVNNLVTNGFRHGKAPVEVAVRPYVDGACLIVSDEGPGIPADQREQVFNKFYQSDSGHARLVEGAGLGLALVHGLVHLHGGRIQIDSTRLDGRGARFTIYFPDVTPEAGATLMPSTAFDVDPDRASRAS